MRTLLAASLAFLATVSGTPPTPDPTDWSGKSSLAPTAATVSGVVSSPWGTDYVGSTTCHYDVKGTACCVDGSDYGHCTNNGAHNCPGGLKKTCTAGLNNQGNNDHSAACPSYISVLGGNPIYPRCQLASQHCQNTEQHCWGVIKCFSDAAGAFSTPCPVGGFVDNSEPTHPVVYAENDFCYEDGQSGVTDWCGACPNGYGLDQTGTSCNTCSKVDSVGTCCDGFDIIGDICCFLSQHEPNSCRAPAGGHGDPQIAGFHGQSFQFHGLADEVFNLISTPRLQVNGHFVYLSSGKCDYNETDCWTHPGTYIDQLGFSIGSHQLKLVSGSHSNGLHMEIDGEPLSHGNYRFQSNGTEVSIEFKHRRTVHIKTSEFIFTVKNSDMFFNIETSMLNQHLLRIGAPKHTITDSQLCKKEDTVDETKFQLSEIKHKHNHGAVESAIEKKYGGIQVPLHGLIGQTWRNVVVCGKHWVGAVSDYVASDLFASDYFFNFFQQ